MTRINLVSPAELSDQHLVAEYREIFMIGSALQRSLKSKNWLITKKNLPKDFTLNRGHVMFFYDKGEYLHDRYLKIVVEMKNRGMRPNPKRKFKKDQWPKKFYNTWEPNDRDLAIVRERIRMKINQKPDWYKWSNKADLIEKN